MKGNFYKEKKGENTRTGGVKVAWDGICRDDMGWTAPKLSGTKRHMIAILVPTRGLVYTEVSERIEEMRRGYWDTKVYYSYGLPIPDSHNSLVLRAMNEEASHFLFIEEDVVLPSGAFKKLLYTTEDISFIDYPVNGYSCSAKNKAGQILWAGLGATMIKRHVFEKLERPWFRSDISLRLNDWTWVKNKESQGYGQQDIWFFMKAREAGFSIRQIPGECRHLELMGLGARGQNKGFHCISQREKIKNYQIIEGGV